MNLDKYGLPIQLDGDAMDQLNRVGMILTANGFSQTLSEFNTLIINCFNGLYVGLKVDLGVYVRHTHGDPQNVSADQLIPVITAWLAMGDRFQVYFMFEQMVKRAGFAQNVRDGLGSNKRQIPDFMFFRTAPLFTRATSTPCSLRYLADLYLLVLVMSDLIYKRFGKDPADVNCTLVTLLTCERLHPTFISRWCWRKWLEHGNVKARLTRYHRAESGGNFEIAKMYEVFL